MFRVNSLIRVNTEVPFHESVHLSGSVGELILAILVGKLFRQKLHSLSTISNMSLCLLLLLEKLYYCYIN